MPITYRAICHFQKTYTKNPYLQLLTKLFRADLYLVSQYINNYHIRIRLTKALRDEKKRRRHDK